MPLFPVSLIKIFSSLFPFFEGDPSLTEKKLEACFVEYDDQECEKIATYIEENNEELFQEYFGMGQRRDCHKQSKEYAKETCHRRDKGCKQKNYDKHYERCENRNAEDDKRAQNVAKETREAVKEVAKEVARSKNNKDQK